MASAPAEDDGESDSSAMADRTVDLRRAGRVRRWGEGEHRNARRI